MQDKKVEKASKKSAITPSTDVSKLESMGTQRFVFLMIGISVLAIVVGGALLYWLVGRYVDQSNKNKAQDETIKLLEQKKVDLAALQPNYDKITSPGQNGKSDGDLILDAMPVDDGFKQLISTIEVMASESGVELSNVTKSAAAAQTTTTSPVPAGTNSYEVSVAVRGSFNNILDFLRKTEQSSRVMNFVSMSIDGSTSAPSIESSIIFTVYYKGPASIAPTQKELK